MNFKINNILLFLKKFDSLIKYQNFLLFKYSSKLLLFIIYLFIIIIFFPLGIFFCHFWGRYLKLI